MALDKLCVTGVTGHIGGLVAKQIASLGREQRLLVRAESKSRAPSLSHSELAHATYGDGAAAESALKGMDVLFMVSAPESEDRIAQHRTFIEAASRAGVRHIIYTSFLGASKTATFTLAREHFTTEEIIRGSGMRFTLLRDSFYLDFLPLLAGPDGVIRGPANEGRVGAVARADVARVAAALLLSPNEHAGKTYNLTGREARTLSEVADIVTQVKGTKTTFCNETVDEAHASRAQFGAPPWQLEAWVSTYTAIAAGELAEVNGNVELLTGRAPLTLREYLTSPG